MISWLLTTLLTSVVFDVALSNGQQLKGDLRALSDTSLTVISPDGEVRRIARDDVQSVRLAVATNRESKGPSGSTWLQLVDRSLVACQRVLIADDAFHAKGLNGGDCSGKTAQVMAIRWTLPSDDAEQWGEILRKAGSEDLLVIRRGQNLDYLKGVVLGISEEAIQFEYSGNTIPVPLAKAAGVVLARKKVDLAPVRLTLATTDGGTWMLRSATLVDDSIRLVSLTGIESSIAKETVVEMKFPQLGSVFLTDLKPIQVKYQPFLGSNFNAALQLLNGPQFDKSFGGGPLRIASASAPRVHAFDRGLALRSRTELVYRLAGKFERFQATVGIAEGAASQADAELLLFSDDVKIGQESVTSVSDVVQLDIDVSGTRRLKVLVDFGENADIGDEVVLGDARLVK